MVNKWLRSGRRTSNPRSAVRSLFLAAALTVAGAGAASAYVGDSFLQVPGLAGDWQGAKYKGWVRADANYWGPDSRRNNIAFGPTKTFYSGPKAPTNGESSLVISVEKNNPVLSRLMEMCTNKTSIPVATYAESAELSRTNLQYGDRPADMPEYFEYKLTDVQISDCPVVEEAPDQAFVVSFKNIEWLNYHGDAKGEPAVFKPSNLKPAASGPKTKSYVLTWFANANYEGDADCDKLNDQPTDDAYYLYMSKEEADKERAENAKNGGVSFLKGQMGERGPHHLNVTRLPGIVKDPVQYLPHSKVARGFNLDGSNDGHATSTTCAHQKFLSEDGEPGIDNQMFAAMACVPGYQGKKGFMMQFVNNQMHDGLLSILLQITGVDNEQNDDSVDVAVFYSNDPMVKNATGSAVGADYTFRLSDKPELMHFFTKLHGRIKNGVLTTDPVKEYHMYLTEYGTPHQLNLADARIRLKFMPDGSVKGFVGGYEDWRVAAGKHGGEQYFKVDAPAAWNAVRRAADGLKDPVTGECNGISSAYDIEGIRAFIDPAAPKVAQDTKKHGQVAEADGQTRQPQPQVAAAQTR